jgi:hypothetical protein
MPFVVPSYQFVQTLQGLAEDLLARGQLDLAETFIDAASFSGAKKGAVELVQHAAAKGARSWQSRTAMIFLSPWGLQALRLMKASSSRPHSSNGSPEKAAAYDRRLGLRQRSPGSAPAAARRPADRATQS